MLENVFRTLKSLGEPSAGIQTHVGVLKYLSSTPSAKQSELSSRFPKLTNNDLRVMKGFGFIESVDGTQEPTYRISEQGMLIYGMRWLPK